MISKQIGQSSEYYLMYEILRKLEQITKIAPYIGWDNGGSTPIPPPIDPSTYLNRFYSARPGGVLNFSGNEPADYEGVFTILDQGTTVSKVNLTYIGATTGLVQKQGSNNDEYGDTDPYPHLNDVDGRFVQIVNSGLGQRFETNPGVSYAGAVTIFYLIRLNPGQANEYDFNVSNGFTMRDRSSGGNFEVGIVGAALTFSAGGRLHVPANFGKWLLVVAERVEETPGSGTFNRMRVNINGTWWNGGELLATGTTPITEHVWGGNSHMSNNSFAASGIYHGAFNQDVYDNFRAYCEYYHGAIGEYSVNEPRINFDAGDGTLIWQTADKSINGPAHTFYSPHGAIEGATEIRLYGSNSATVTTAIENRTYIMTKVVGVDANPYKFIRGTDFGTPGEPATQTNVQYWLEYLAVDSSGRRQRIASITQNFRDNLV